VRANCPTRFELLLHCTRVGGTQPKRSEGVEHSPLALRAAHPQNRLTATRKEAAVSGGHALLYGHVRQRAALAASQEKVCESRLTRSSTPTPNSRRVSCPEYPWFIPASLDLTALGQAWSTARAASRGKKADKTCCQADERNRVSRNGHCCTLRDVTRAARPQTVRIKPAKSFEEKQKSRRLQKIWRTQ